MGIRYVHADATVPQTDGNVVIARVCNDLGGWGRDLWWRYLGDGRQRSRRTCYVQP